MFDGELLDVGNLAGSTDGDSHEFVVASGDNDTGML